MKLKLWKGQFNGLRIRINNMLNIDFVNFVFDFVVKPIVIVIVFLGVINASRVRPAGITHGILTMGILSIFLSFLFSFFMPDISLPIVPESLNFLTSIHLEYGNKITYTLFLLCVGCYFFISLTLFFTHLLGVLELIRLTRSSTKIIDKNLKKNVSAISKKLNLKRSVEIYVSEKIDIPAIWGIFKIRLMLPNDYKNWQVDRLNRVLIHELAHAVRYDWATKTWVNTLMCFLWFVPLIYLMRKELFWYAEIAADDFVLRSLQKREDYAEDLIDISSHSVIKQHFLVTLIHQSGLFERIDSILSPSRDRTPVNFTSKINIVFLTMIFLIPFSVAKLDIHQASDLYFTFGDVRNGFLDDTHTEKTNRKNSDALLNSYSMPTAPVSSIFPLRNREEQVLIESAKSIDIELAADITNIDSSIEPSIKIVDVSGLIPNKLVTPSYPREALLKNIEGFVIARFDVNSTGRVVNIRIVESEPRKIFNRAVKKALSKSKFLPMVLDGESVSLKNMTEEFHFKLISGTAN